MAIALFITRNDSLGLIAKECERNDFKNDIYFDVDSNLVLPWFYQMNIPQPWSSQKSLSS